MADLALSAAQTLLAALQSTALKDVCSMWGYKSDLEALKETVTTIQKVFLDAEAQPQLSNQAQYYIDKLKAAVYDADDLFDEIRTLAELKQLHKGDKFSHKVHDFFSSKKNPLSNAYTVSNKVKKIRKKLEDIASDHAKFGLKFDSGPIRERRPDSCSYVYAPSIIGREDDKKAIIERLLNSNEGEGGVEFLSIVGVGGLGKTVLAQLVYDDDRIKSEFPLRLWACVADQDGQNFDAKSILSKLLKSASSSMEELANEFQKKLGGKKCFIVLDDIWNEDQLVWDDLKGFLLGLGAGSKIMATSRSLKTAQVIGYGDDTRVYELKGLTEENSWDLFKLTAFQNGYNCGSSTGLDEFVMIGKKIVIQCFNVPLIIKVVGSLLFGHGIEKWRSFQENGLEKITQGDDKIMSILKLSYDNLSSSLKNCFVYCALFPKDHVIKKNMLISLWLAQGYVKPFYEGQNIEAAAEEHFVVLLRRCFFQDVKTNDFDNVVSCKIHDMMHDVAVNVGGKEFGQASCIANNIVDVALVHISEDRYGGEFDICSKAKIRSYLHIGNGYANKIPKLDPLLTKWECLRSLSVKHASLEKLPDSIGRLLHLRYLDLNYCSKLKMLPNSITELLNLQTLILKGCGDLKELPKKFSKLMNLRYLDINYTDLSYMPEDMDKLSCLSVLTAFYVAESGNQSVSGLSELKALRSLTGVLQIRFPRKYEVEEERDEEIGYLANMHLLNHISITFWEGEEAEVEKGEAVMRKLQPHPNLMKFESENYEGREIGRWGTSQHNWVSILPNFVSIKLYNCERLLHLPLLSQLLHLKDLSLVRLEKVEYIEKGVEQSTSTSCCVPDSAQLPFFPSLEYLWLKGMKKLKGWWSCGGGAGFVGHDICHTSRLPSFPRLSELIIEDCPNMITFPCCPTLETVSLRDTDERLRLITPTTASRDIIDSSASLVNLREVSIQNVGDLRALPPCHPTHFYIDWTDMESFSGEDEMLLNNTCGFSSVKTLSLNGCRQLKSLSGGGFQNLTALESLAIRDCPKLKVNEEDDGDGIPWRSLHHSLRSLKLSLLPMLENLPRGMQYLTSLQHLSIWGCENIEGIPEWISCLSSLQSLYIYYCEKIKSLPEAMRNLTSLHRLTIKYSSKELCDRCRAPNGDDWPKIQHIPSISIYE